MLDYSCIFRENRYFILERRERLCILNGCHGYNELVITAIFRCLAFKIIYFKFIISYKHNLQNATMIVHTEGCLDNATNKCIGNFFIQSFETKYENICLHIEQTK